MPIIIQEDFMNDLIEKTEARAEALLRPDLEELVRAANQRLSREPFHVRDLADAELWRAWYRYWRKRNISVVLQLGKDFYHHPGLKARFIGYDPNPKDGAAMYVNP